MKIQKVLLEGVNYIDQVVNTDTDQADTEKQNYILGAISRLIDAAFNIVDRIVPFRGTVQRIRNKFNPSVASLFVTYRFLNGLSLFNLILYTNLFFKHNF